MACGKTVPRLLHSVRSQYLGRQRRWPTLIAFFQTDRLYPRSGEYAVHTCKEKIAEEPDVIKWGLDPGLLALVENYIRLPIAYRGLTVRRECADGRLTGTRMWDRYNEDAAILKIIVYLNDVDLEAGPFQYIPAPEWRVRLVESSRVTDADIERLVPRSHWVPCAYFDPAALADFAHHLTSPVNSMLQSRSE